MEVPDSKLQEMVNSAFGYAKKMFEEFGDFFPFGVALNSSGETEMRGTVKVDEEHDSPEFVLMLQKMYRERVRSGDILAAAIGVHVDIPPQIPADYPDGIAIFLETSSSSRGIYLPYEIQGNREEPLEGEGKLLVKYGKPIGVAMPPQIFCDENDA